jgi:hypothetical protein
MDAAQRHMRPALPVVIGDGVCPVGVGDIDLDGDKIGCVVKIQALHVLVLKDYLVILMQISGQRGQPQGWEERVLDGPPVR